MKCNSQSVVQNCYFLFQGTWCPYCSVVEGYQLCVLLQTLLNAITRSIVVATAAAFHYNSILIFIFCIYINGYEDVAINLEIEVLFSGTNR